MISPVSAKLVSDESVRERTKLRYNSDTSRLAERLDDEAARVRELYDGFAGGLLNIGSVASLHQPLLGRLLNRGIFDLHRFRRVLDVGTGAGQILKHLVKLAPSETAITACDLSEGMLQRARAAVGRLSSLSARQLRFQLADVNQLPFADESFDLVTCGYVLEHLTDLRQGLRELHRVLAPGGSLLLSATEDTLLGHLCGRLWSCRTLNRNVLRDACKDAGLPWSRQLWFSSGHRLLKMGGILVEARRES